MCACCQTHPQGVDTPVRLLFFPLSLSWKGKLFYSREKFSEIDDKTEARKRGFPNSTKSKSLTYDFISLIRTNEK